MKIVDLTMDSYEVMTDLAANAAGRAFLFPGGKSRVSLQRIRTDDGMEEAVL